MDFVIFILSLGALIWGSDLLVTQSERLALRVHTPQQLVGVMLVALGTSLPEMAVSMAASIYTKPQIAISNAIGSTIFNITLILASVFLVSKELKPKRDFFTKDSIWMLAPILIFILMISDGIVSRFDAALLLFFMGAYIYFLMQDSNTIAQEALTLTPQPFGWIKTISMIFSALVLLVLGAYFTVESASDIATGFGMSDWTVGVLMVALGTSLPELIIGISAAMKGKADMAIGGIIASNMANITVVIGMAGLISPLKLDSITYLFDIEILVGATLILVFITANKLYTKVAGMILLVLLGLFLDHTLRGL